MAELPAINSYSLQSHPEGGPPGADAYRWRVWLEEDIPLWVELGGSQAIETGLGRTQLNERLPLALQRYARGVLRNDSPLPDQVLMWSLPVLLRAEHFE